MLVRAILPITAAAVFALMGGCSERAGDERAAEAPADAGQPAEGQESAQEAPGTTTTFENPEEQPQ
ncbi:MAG TPA: hypothetical protein VK025_06660 [Steroidobacter sp.]|nr:hypothetical protein [Steroidobacteraceae bacterium]HLS81065.1 hypothetical protein [Steroidobacter sp.]